jgi:hypothetical protein
MSPLAWTLTAVVGFSALWLLIPLVAAWASHSGRLDPFLAGVGRFLEPVGRRVAPVGAWLMRHPLAGATFAAVPGLGVAVVSVAKGRSELAVVQGLIGLVNSGMMVLNLREARRRQQTQPPTSTGPASDRRRRLG